MKWLTSLVRRQSFNPSRKPRARLAVENLEERQVLTTLAVVPATAVAGIPTRFATLQSALDASHPGDVIQIELNSAPGSANVNTPGLTIQGNPSAAVGLLPRITTLNFFASSETVTHLNVDQVFIQPTLDHVTVSDSWVGGVVDNGNGFCVFRDNVIRRDVRVVRSTTAQPLVGDQILGNRFVAPSQTDLPSSRISLNNAQQVLIDGNVILRAVTYGIEIRDSTQVTVNRNTIDLPNTSNGLVGVLVASQTTANAAVTNNRIDTHFANVGLYSIKQQGATSLLVAVAQNDLVANQVGVLVVGDGTNSSGAFGLVDLGGGALGSTGGNDFQGFAQGNRDALQLANNGQAATGATVAALFNVWGTDRPNTVNDPVAGSTVNTGTGLDANRGFVQTVYHQFLHRGASPGELDTWNQVVASLGRGTVAQLISHSGEAFTWDVDDAYRRFLGRAADAGASAAWVGFLNQGATVEQVYQGILSSGELADRASQFAAIPGSSDGNYVQALYQMLLGRDAGAAEISVWQGQVAAVGRSQVAGALLGSGEFRGRLVRRLYGETAVASEAYLRSVATTAPDMLHRPAGTSAAEVAAWANSTLDLLSMESGMASTDEFFAKG
jgi:hypothetical protein